MNIQFGKTVPDKFEIINIFSGSLSHLVRVFRRIFNFNRNSVEGVVSGVGDFVRVYPVPWWGGDPLDVYRGVVCAGQVGHQGAGRARHVRD